jgi:hypothetical protein
LFESAKNQHKRPDAKSAQSGSEELKVPASVDALQQLDAFDRQVNEFTIDGVEESTAMMSSDGNVTGVLETATPNLNE